MKITGLFLLLLSFSSLCAQPADSSYHHRYFHPLPVAGRSTGTSGTGANIDVLYQRMEWTVNPVLNNVISGTATIRFKTTNPNVSALDFDLNKASFDNATLQVSYHGTGCVKSFPATGNVNILQISLPVTIPAANTIDSVVIVYSGTPPPASGAAQGYQRFSYTDQSGVTQYYTGSLSESYEDRDWWPCKADMQDKVDSMDMIVTVPWNGADTFWVAANGKLVDSTIAGNSRTFTYSTKYPIASYLVSLSVGKFNRYFNSVNINGTEVPVHYYLLTGKTPSYYNNAVTALDKINAVVQAFSVKLGDYPFKLEKHGFYDGLVGASGMEHQTFSAMASGAITSISTLSHELMHQWFGDNVTFATWNDLWLAEGFAKYGESLAGELVPSLGLNVQNMRNSMRNSAINLGSASAWIPNSNTGNSGQIWNTSYGSTVYQRGGMIVSMLRAISGDAKFFQALTNYQTLYKGKAVSADSLKKQFNLVLGQDISEFFNDYAGGSGTTAAIVGGIGNPVNNVIWNAASNVLFLRQGTQTRSASSNVAYFNGPVAVKATDGIKDTTIIYYDWGNGDLSYAGAGLSDAVSGNLLSYPLSFTPTSVVYDDAARTLSTGSTTQNTTIEGYTWYGTADNNWNNAANWSACCGVPPLKGADITIATVNAEPVLPSAFSVRHLTIQTGKNLNIGAHELTVTGKISGTGTFTGSEASQLLLTGDAGDLFFNQLSANTKTVSKLTMETGSKARLLSDLNAHAVQLKTGAVLSVAAGKNLTTH